VLQQMPPTLLPRIWFLTTLNVLVLTAADAGLTSNHPLEVLSICIPTLSVH